VWEYNEMSFIPACTSLENIRKAMFQRDRLNALRDAIYEGHNKPFAKKLLAELAWEA
jgi:hypothetical protein